MVKNLPADVGDVVLTPGLGRSPGEGNYNPLQILSGKFHEQRSLSGYRPCGHKKSDTTEQLNNNKCSFGNKIHKCFYLEDLVSCFYLYLITTHLFLFPHSIFKKI